MSPPVLNDQITAPVVPTPFASRAAEDLKPAPPMSFAASPPLELNVLLGGAAQAHADDMARGSYLSHDSRSGESAFDRMTGAGFAGCALSENIARGQPSADAVVAAWLASPPHCENVHWDKVRFLGVGYSKSDDEFAHYWVQDFGG
jgi:uncharacterized protein YkwD